MRVLQFSGGKDSLACLHLLRDEWDTLTVVWMNAGAPFPETLALMDDIRHLVPHFREIRADVLADIEQNGLPVDTLPVKLSGWGKAFTDAPGPQMRTFMDCCAANVWRPMHQAMIEMGATVVIRGQRNAEGYKSPIPHGAIVEGMRFEFPLRDWTAQQVDEFLAAQGVQIPAYYAHSDKSLDCWNCTAYMDEKRGTLAYMRAHHREKYDHVIRNLKDIDIALNESMRPLRRALGDS